MLHVLSSTKLLIRTVRNSTDGTAINQNKT